MAIDKKKLVEKLKGLPDEDRKTFREAMSEIDPDGFLSPDELFEIREMLRIGKEKTVKPKGFLETFLNS